MKQISQPINGRGTALWRQGKQQVTTCSEMGKQNTAAVGYYITDIHAPLED
jgi:hypothetical protein